MKTFVLLDFFFLLIMVSFSNAQVRRIVLLEEATNSSCTDCFESNVKLQTFVKSHFGGVISVRYHADWPGGDDPMFVLNPTDNNHRIRDYYGMWFVADYFMDGIDYGEPLDSLIMIDQMNHHLSKDAPVKIRITTNIDADSVRATLRLIGVSPVTPTNLKFRTAVIERMVQYSSPPGSNGEKIFPDVMRKMLPDTSGFDVNGINPGEQITYHVSYPVNPAWKWQDLAVVAWLQSDGNREITMAQTTNHEIIQSNISIPTYIIESHEPLSEFLSLNQKLSKTLTIINDNDVTLHLRLKETGAEVPSGWSYDFIYNSISFHSADVAIIPGDSIVFGLNVNTNSNPGIIRLAIFAENLDDPYNYGYTWNYFGITKTDASSVLVVDDDGGSNSEMAYLPAFDSLGIRYTSIEKRFVSELVDQITPEDFRAVFWNISEESQRVSPLDINFLENYLRNGGNLFFTVSDPYIFRTFSWFFVIWNYQVMDFCHNFLDAEFHESFSSNSLFAGIPGTLGEGITTDLGSGLHIRIGSYSGASDTIFQYIGTQDYGGLSYDAGTYRAVFLGVGLEQFTAASARKSLIQKVMNWFEAPVGVLNDKVDVPTQYSLEQNYPNPFNPVTKIRYEIPLGFAASRLGNGGIEGRFVTLKVYDVLGNEVATLVNEAKQAGTYEVTWKAAGLSSGVYFYRLQTGSYVETKKMILLR